MPHPSENLVNVRVQTSGEVTATEAMRQSLTNLNVSVGAQDCWTIALRVGGFLCPLFLYPLLAGIIHYA